MRHSQAWVMDGAHISNVVELSSLGRGWVDSPAEGGFAGRVELNPNKVTPRVLEIVRSLRVDHVSRCDVALDYEGVAIGDYAFSRPRVKGQYWTGGDGVESLYLGSRASERFVRVYDKARELKVEGTMTRVEAVGRHRHVLAEDLLDGVAAHARVLRPGMDAHTAGLVACALYCPEVVRGFDKRTRRRCAELVQANQAPLSPDPAEVYRDALPGLDDMVSAISAGESVPVARVYREAVRDE